MQRVPQYLWLGELGAAFSVLLQQISCWPPVAQPGTTTTMPQESVSVDSGYTAAVMATRWRLTTVTAQLPQREKMTTILGIVHSDTL